MNSFDCEESRGELCSEASSGLMNDAGREDVGCEDGVFCFGRLLKSTSGGSWNTRSSHSDDPGVDTVALSVLVFVCFSSSESDDKSLITCFLE
jgi:hypothetical protein